MKISAKIMPFLASYILIVLGFFAFWFYADAKLEKKVRELQKSQTSIKSPIGDFIEVKGGWQDERNDGLDALVKHIQTPEAVKGIYVTAATVTISKFDKLLDLAARTELNTIVLDIKDWKQRPAFAMRREALKTFNVADPAVRDLEALVKKVHDKGIYLVARIAVFQDPYIVNKKPEWALHSKNGGVWKDWKGVTWLDSTNHDVWDYNVELAREAYERGFDEINFDYVRFPSDGPVNKIVYANYDGKTDKSIEMQKFFSYLDHELRRKGIPISVDLFGLVTAREDGLGIGQRYADAAPFFDAVCPMVYPSHYPATYQGFANPAAHPYEIVLKAMQWGVAKTAELTVTSTPLNSSGKPVAKLRPWLQDFDLGANYDAPMVRKQIQATYDAGLTGWFLWNASNNYTEGALEKGG